MAVSNGVPSGRRPSREKSSTRGESGEYCCLFRDSPDYVVNLVEKADLDDGVKPGVTSLSQLNCVKQSRVFASGAARLVVEAHPRVCFASITIGKRLYPLVSDLAGYGIHVTLSCRVLKLARVLHYRWVKNSAGKAER